MILVSLRQFDKSCRNVPVFSKTASMH